MAVLELVQNTTGLMSEKAINSQFLTSLCNDSPSTHPRDFCETVMKMSHKKYV